MPVKAVKNENFLVIQGWMITELGLKDKELLLYALIYGFTQEENEWFSGSLEYIAQWLQVDRRNVASRYIRPLVEDHLLLKQEITVGNHVYYRYKAVKPPFEPKEDNLLTLTRRIEEVCKNSMFYKRSGLAGKEAEDNAVKGIVFLQSVAENFGEKNRKKILKLSDKQIEHLFQEATNLICYESDVVFPEKIMSERIKKEIG